MRSFINRCILTVGDAQTVFDAELHNDCAEIKKDVGSPVVFKAEKHTVCREFVQNLDVFFNRYNIKEWSGVSENTCDKLQDSVKIIYDDGAEYFVTSENALAYADELFSDLKRYFNAYISGNVEPYIISFSSFDGGGPKYSVETQPKGIFTWYSNSRYMKADHENLCGAGYDIIYRIYPLRVGSGTADITGHSPICPAKNIRLFIDVDSDLKIMCRKENIPGDIHDNF